MNQKAELAARLPWAAAQPYFRRVLQCENRECPYRNSWRRLLRNRKEGVFLQGRWFCSLDCFEHAIEDVFTGLIQLPDEPLKRMHRIPLGLLLLGRGVIDESQLKAALETQRREGADRLGQWFIRLGIISAQEISAALALQWGCGVFPLEQDRRFRECAQMVPLVLMESSRMLPVHYGAENRTLYLAFSEDIDHTAIYSIERLLGGRTEPCVVTDKAMQEAMNEIRGDSRPGEIVFEKRWTAPEMAHTIRDYAVKLGADELRLARPRQFLWARLNAAGHSLDLLFRLPPRTAEGNAQA
ncbi:MAG: hypothetical protein ACRD4M_08995 [Candidatus Acidiferrales bacterium]